MQKVITQCEPGINNIKKWNVFSWYCIWLPNAQSFISRWWFWWNSLNSFVFRCYLRRSFYEDKSSFAAAVACLHPVKYLRPYYKWQICKMLKTSTVSKRHQLVSASHSVFTGWTNTGGHENSAHKRIKSAQILSSPVSLGLTNFLSPHQHPLTPVTNTRQRDARAGKEAATGATRGTNFTLPFLICLRLVCLRSGVSVRFPSAWPFVAFPIDRFPRQTPDDFALVCVGRLLHRSPARWRILISASRLYCLCMAPVDLPPPCS